jgi:tRNA A-37 threonylcarbamoyl transferase component Bud32
VEIREWTLTSELGTARVSVPIHLTDRLPPGPSDYTLRATVPLPEGFRGQDLTLTIAHLPALAELRVNGHEAVALDVSAFDRYRSNGPHRWRIIAEYATGPTVSLELLVHHRWVESAWVDWVPTLSATRAGDTRYLIVTSFNQVTAIAALVTMLLVSLLHAVIYLLDRHRVVHAWHAMQGVFAAAYPALLLGYLQPVFGTGDIVVSAVAITIAAVTSVFFVAAMFEKPPPTKAWWLFVALTTLAALVAYRPFTSTLSAPPTVLALSAVSIYGVRTYAEARRKGHVSFTHALASLGFPIALVCGVPDAISLLGFGDVAWGLRGSSLAIGCVSMLQAVALSRSHTASLKRSDQLNEELQARVVTLEKNNREIQVLNDELRRQVAARSEHLADVLAKLGPVFARPRDFVAGEIIDMRYTVVRRVGEGGMGTVYEVERRTDGRRLALKVLQGYRTGAELARLAREAQIAARVDHPNVVAMVDVDVSASGAVFLVMEYVDGCSLDDLGERYGDAPWALGLLRQITAGLAVMHEHDIVHRDLKPGNVLVTRDAGGKDVAKIADFGIATLSADGDETTAARGPALLARTAPSTPDVAQSESRDDRTTDRNLTRTGQVLGTPLYMAPELALGARNATPASDVYAVGVMAFEILTGGVPSGYERLDHLRGVQRTTPGFRDRSPGLAPRIASLLERCLAPEPADRPSARELAEALSC